MRRALQSLSDSDPNPSGIALVEAELLGVLILVPYLRLDCATLRPSDFSSPHRGAAFAAIMLCPHPELGLVVDHLERSQSPPPPGRTGWGDALARCMDVAFVESDAVPEAVTRIKESARRRRLAEIMGGPDGSGPY